MVCKKYKILFVSLIGLTLIGAQAARAEPMKCSGEEQICATNCRKAARMAVSVCLTECGARGSACMKTGCWDDGRQTYCGLLRR